MKITTIVLLLTLVAVPLSAQYIPPARDFQEASRIATECMRAIEPGLASMREQHEVLVLFNRVQRQLADDNAGALTSAVDSIDEWVRMRQQSDKPISRDMQRQIDRVREMIVLAQNGPPPTDLRPLRENIHHDHIHALQKLVLTNVGQLQQFAESQLALERLVRTLITASVNAAATGSSEVKR